MPSTLTPSPAQTRTLRIGHSPDPDDAFMWYPLADFTGPDGRRYRPQIDTGGYRFDHVLEDIQSLNERTESAEPSDKLEITALSMHQYPFIAKDYVLTSCGSSMGEGYGPMVISAQSRELRQLIDPANAPDQTNRPVRFAIPGRRTTAWLALQLLMNDHGVHPEPEGGHNVEYIVVPFDQIIPRVQAGEFDAGLIIHEGQITYEQAGLHLVVDLGRWWKDTRDLPLPLGGNAIRRDLVDSGQAEGICGILARSIRYAMDHRAESVNFALNYAREMDNDLADRFVGMYVNDRTIDYGQTGRAAVQRLFSEATQAGLTPALPHQQAEFVSPPFSEGQH